MQPDWRDLTYLLHGTATQHAAYQALAALRVFPLLQPFDPILAGTVPLDIDLPGSDLDVVCYAADVDAFARHLSASFGHCASFGLSRKMIDGLPTVIARCTSQGFPVEIFGQPRPVMAQAAVRHLLVEARLLRYGGAKVRRKVYQLKAQGLKTEPAFALVIGLAGDPYQTLLALSAWPEEALMAVIATARTPHQRGDGLHP
jgi:hypothetical protein